MNQLIEKIKTILKENSNKDYSYCEDDDFIVYDACGGNTDDAFYLGQGYGQWELAKTLLDILEKYE